MADTYNGYTNFETWLVALWLDNDQASQEQWQAEARDCLETALEDLESVSYVPFDEERVRSDATYTLAGMLKEYINDERPDSQGMYDDLLSAALSVVNWTEIARNYITNLEHA